MNVWFVLAGLYVVSIIAYASLQPLSAWINQPNLWGVIGITPAFAGPLALPAIILVLIGAVRS